MIERRGGDCVLVAGGRRQGGEGGCVVSALVEGGCLRIAALLRFLAHARRHYHILVPLAADAENLN